jgi:heterodisulfide reductase subunit A
VNPSGPYCSRVCCTHSIESALAIKTRNPEANVYILYRDIRTYGERETLYKKAREAGVIFIRYALENKPQVVRDGERLAVRVTDHVLGLPMEITTDLVTLAAAIVPYADEQLAQFFKIPVNDDGFFVEKHAKLGPIGFCHRRRVSSADWPTIPSPLTRPLPRARPRLHGPSTLLAQEIHQYQRSRWPRLTRCFAAACGVCVSICPYSAPSFIDADARMHAGKAQINPVLVQRLRPVRGRLPLRGHSFEGLRQ